MFSDKMLGFAKFALAGSVVLLGMSIIEAIGLIPFLFGAPFFPDTFFNSGLTRKQKIREYLTAPVASPLTSIIYLTVGALAFVAGCFAGAIGGVARLAESREVQAARRERERLQNEENRRIEEQIRQQNPLLSPREIRTQRRELQLQRELILALFSLWMQTPSPEEIEQIEQQTRAAHQAFLDAKPDQSEQRLADLKQIYATYQNYTRCFLPEIEKTFRDIDDTPLPDEDKQHLNAYQVALGSSKMKHVLDKPLTNEQLAVVESRFCLITEEKTKGSKEKNPNQNIFNAAFFDYITSDTMRTPIRLPDGRTYDALTVNSMPLPRTLPENQHQDFELNEIIPNNTLGKAILYLEKNSAESLRISAVYNATLRTKAEAIKQSKAYEKGYAKTRCITSNDVTRIDQHYATLDPHQKNLFDLLCKDPLTGVTFQDPVYLPDGYTYERSTALALLKTGTAFCPQASHIQFTQKNIITCYATRNVLEKIKEELAVFKLVKTSRARTTTTYSSTATAPQTLFGKRDSKTQQAAPTLVAIAGRKLTAAARTQ